MSFEQLRCQIAAQLDRGDDLAAIETEWIEPVWWLSEDDRAALWLFAWSYRKGSGGGLSHYGDRLSRRVLSVHART